MELSNIFESEHEENWRIVFAQYTELYRQSPSIDVAMHFAFFCWYLLWQWDEISFPGETLSPYEKGTVDTRNGISKSKLLFDLDVTTKHLLTSPDNTPVKYLIVLCLMKKFIPIFSKRTLSLKSKDNKWLLPLVKSLWMMWELRRYMTICKHKTLQTFFQPKESLFALYSHPTA